MFGKSKPSTDSEPAASASGLAGAASPGERHPAAAVLPESRVKPSVISDAVEFLGELRTRGALHVDGRAEGAIDAESVTIGSTGSVKGTVHCGRLHIKGRFTGDVVCDELVIAAEATVDGSLSYGTILVQRGATIAGDFFHREAGSRGSPD